MNDRIRPFIVGAGPVGLTAALFLERQGLPARIVDALDEPVHESKALAVNPRTLDILESTGVTRRMLEIGLPIHEAQLHRRGRVVASVSFAGIHPRYPFMLALSQATTERLLTEALHQAGGRIDRGVKLIDCRAIPDGVEATFESFDHREVAACPWLLAAEGAHSVARERLGNQFEGSTLPGEWYLADVPLRTRLPADRAHIILLDDAFLFLIRVVDAAHQDRGEGPLWRVMCNLPDPLARLQSAEQSGPAVWTSSFRVSHRICAQVAVGNVYFAGDAAHIHSPMGARGMNLGIEDAFVFAELVRSNSLSRYHELRRSVDARVVAQVEMLTRFVSGQSLFTRFVRRLFLPMAMGLPIFRKRMIRTLSGLDHDLPRFASSAGAAAPAAT